MANTRKLEFYGYRDQNNYKGMSKADIDQIEIDNREQSNDIATISSVTSTKADMVYVAKFEDNVNMFLTKQNSINKNLGDGINSIGKDLDKVSSAVSGISTALGNVTETVRNQASDIEATNAKLKDVLDTHNADTSEIAKTLDSVNGLVTSVRIDLCNKLSLDEASINFAKKNNVYTKAEIDKLSSDADVKYAAIDVVNDKFVTKSDGDEKYLLRDDFESMRTDYEKFKAEVRKKCNETVDTVSSFQSNTSKRLDIINDRIDLLKTLIESLTSRIDAIEKKIKE